VKMHWDPGLAHQHGFWQQADIPTEYPDGMPVEPEPASDLELESPPALRLPKMPENSLSKAMRRWKGTKTQREPAARANSQTELTTQARPVEPRGNAFDLPYRAPGSAGRSEYEIEPTTYQEPNRTDRASYGPKESGPMRLPQVP